MTIDRLLEGLKQRDPRAIGRAITLVENGDVFSVVSGRQHDAALGQLGLLGRLNRRTAGHEMVHVIPCGIDGGSNPPDDSDSSDPGPATLPFDAFVVLWSGGFNTWCDVPTLASGIEAAMPFL